MDVVGSFRKANDMLFHINESLKAPLKTIRSSLNDILVGPDCFYIISELPIKTENTSDILNTINKVHAFKYATVGNTKNIIKQLTDRIMITLTESSDNIVTAYVSYKLLFEEAKLLFPTEDTQKLRLGLICNYKNFRI
jgi:hypothetical protein